MVSAVQNIFSSLTKDLLGTTIYLSPVGLPCLRKEVPCDDFVNAHVNHVARHVGLWAQANRFEISYSKDAIVLSKLGYAIIFVNFKDNVATIDVRHYDV